jgi:hypothetical protein
MGRRAATMFAPRTLFDPKERHGWLLVGRRRAGGQQSRRLAAPAARDQDGRRQLRCFWPGFDVRNSDLRLPGSVGPSWARWSRSTGARRRWRGRFPIVTRCPGLRSSQQSSGPTRTCTRCQAAVARQGSPGFPREERGEEHALCGGTAIGSVRRSCTGDGQAPPTFAVLRAA